MTTQKLNTYAPMITNPDEISKNSMKFYSYLLCIAGLASFPENTRMFRHKNLILTQIQRATGITDKTAKLYLYYLEDSGLIFYKGDRKASLRGDSFSDEETTEHVYLQQNPSESYKDYMTRVRAEAARVWKTRNKREKEGVYHIPRPNPYTPIPETTLDKLNVIFEVTELEMKIYTLCCRYRDVCVQLGQGFKTLAYEQLRESLGYTQQSVNNGAIRRALYLLKGIGLLEFEEQQYTNSRGTKIPCFKIKDVQYYVSYCPLIIGSDDLEVKDIVQRLAAIDESCYQEA